MNFDSRRDEIIRMAAHLFATKGFHATSTNDICDALGINRGLLYHYVSSKEEILFLIHEQFIDPLLDKGYQIFAKEKPADQLLEELSLVVIETIFNFHDEVTVFLHEWRSLVDNPDRWQRVRQKRREFAQIVEDTIRAGEGAGLFEVDNPRLSALAFFNLHNFTYQWLRSDGQLSAREISRHFMQLFLNGLRRRIDYPPAQAY